MVLATGAAQAKKANDPVQWLEADTHFYVPKPNQGARDQINDLISGGRKAEADLIRKMIDTP